MIDEFEISHEVGRYCNLENLRFDIDDLPVNKIDFNGIVHQLYAEARGWV